ncbi:MAG: hypothetical protein LBU36_04335 [Clostridiales bacterium]|jgi:hypothetical protein|nr:hypothetical protein [Clostridiales bacterium]
MSKKFGFLLSLALLTAAFGAPARADENPPVSSNAEFTAPALFKNHLTIDGESIGTSGRSWVQPSGNFKSYRVYVSNTGSDDVTVTVTKDGTAVGGSYKIPAGGDKQWVNNSAEPGATYTLGFTSKSGPVSGTVSVRVSEERLS